MNKIILNLGVWASIICLASFTVWIISFTGIALTSPLFYWTNIEDYIQYVNTNNQFFKYLAQSFMIVFAIAYMVLVFVFHEFTIHNKQILSKIAVAFAIMFTLLASIHYFIQISTVRFALMEQGFAGLEQFLQAKPTSAISSANMLGWTLFFGLSSLFMYLAFIPDTATKSIRIGFLINAISCLLAGVGYLFQIDVITFIFINLGVGAAIIAVCTSAIRFFIKSR